MALHLSRTPRGSPAPAYLSGKDNPDGQTESLTLGFGKGFGKGFLPKTFELGVRSSLGTSNPVEDLLGTEYATLGRGFAEALLLGAEVGTGMNAELFETVGAAAVAFSTAEVTS